MKFKQILLFVIFLFVVGCVKEAIQPGIYTPSQIISSPQQFVGKEVVVEGIIATNTVVCSATGVCSYSALLVDSQEIAEIVRPYLFDYSSYALKLKYNDKFLGCGDKTEEDENSAFGFKVVGIDCGKFEANKKYQIKGKINSIYTSLYGYATNIEGEKVPVGNETSVYYIEIETFNKISN